MWSHENQELLAEFCIAAGLSAQQSVLLKTGALLCDGVPVSLMQAEDDKTALRVFVQFGEMPVQVSAAAMRRLLEVNLLLPATHSPRLGIDSVNGKVLFAYQLRAPSPASLRDSVRFAVAEALRWQQDFYLDACEARP